MKKTALSMAVGSITALSVSSADAAMYINELGTGETLLFLSIPPRMATIR